MTELAALHDFRRARRQASMQELLSRLTGRSSALLPYEEVRQKLKAQIAAPLGLQDIPIDSIVGSVGRYSDFNRSFLPLQDTDEARWSRIRTATLESGGLPPIEVYRVGDVYFVQDGHHRVSVARRLGATHIQAYVTDIQSRVPLSPGTQPDDLILKAEQLEFLEKTGLDQLRPASDVSVTVPGQYARLLEHIAVHRYYMGLERRQEIPYEEAVAHFYDQVYLPVVQVIRRRGMLRDFPGRTETDLYLFSAEHRAALVGELGWEIEPERVAAQLSDRFGPRPGRFLARVRDRLVALVTPDPLEGGPGPGQWRHDRQGAREDDRLFADILVTISGDEKGWHALDQSLDVAKREKARLLGLHVVRVRAERERPRVRALRAEFGRRCAEAGVQGSLAVDAGKVARKIAERSRWADLTVVYLSHPPPSQPLRRLSSGFRNLLLWSSTPVLAVPIVCCSPMRSALLAYDGSPRAREALYVAAYLAAAWKVRLVVVVVVEGERVTPAALGEARSYLEEHGIKAVYLEETGPVAEAVLRAADDQGSDLILMGGYGRSPVMDAVVGSTVDRVLRESRRPILICR